MCPSGTKQSVPEKEVTISGSISAHNSAVFVEGFRSARVPSRVKCVLTGRRVLGSRRAESETGSRGSCVAKIPQRGGMRQGSKQGDSASAGGGVAGRAQDERRAWRTGAPAGPGAGGADVSALPCPCSHRTSHTWDNRRGLDGDTHTTDEPPNVMQPSGVWPCFRGMRQTRQSHRDTQWIHACRELGGGGLGRDHSPGQSCFWSDGIFWNETGVITAEIHVVG